MPGSMFKIGSIQCFFYWISFVVFTLYTGLLWRVSNTSQTRCEAVQHDGVGGEHSLSPVHEKERCVEVFDLCDNNGLGLSCGNISSLKSFCWSGLWRAAWRGRKGGERDGEGGELWGRGQLCLPSRIIWRTSWCFPTFASSFLLSASLFPLPHILHCQPKLPNIFINVSLQLSQPL